MLVLLFLGHLAHQVFAPLPKPEFIPPLTKVGMQAPGCQADAQPGWHIGKYGPTARVGGLSPDLPLGETTTPSLPINLSIPTSIPASTALKPMYVTARFLVCEAGSYAFGFYVEAPLNGVLCDLFVDVNKTRIVGFQSLNIRTEEGIQQFLGKDLRLGPGLVDVGIWMNCAERQFSGFSTATVTHRFATKAWGETTFTLKVRAPGEKSLRDFKPDEIYLP